MAMDAAECGFPMTLRDTFDLPPIPLEQPSTLSQFAMGLPYVTSSDVRNLPRPAVFLGGYGRFVAVTAEAFAASRRS